MEEDDNKLKITCKHCNSFVTCKDSSGEMIYIPFIRAGLSTLGIYPEELGPENFYFQWPSRIKYNACIRIFCNKIMVITIT